MTTLLGKGLLLAGCSALGIGQGLSLRRRRVCLQEFRRAIEGLIRELSFSLLPLSDLLEQAEGESTGEVNLFFRTCREDFAHSGGESWAESWGEALAQTDLPLKESDLALLKETGQILGRYDGESQRLALDKLLSRLERAAEQAEEEEKRLFRVYAVTGIAAGLFAVLLLS